MEVAIIILSSIIFIGFGFFGVRKPNKSEKTKLGWFRIAAGIAMSFVGGAATVTMAGLGYKYGWISLVDPIAVLVGGIIVVLIVDKIRIPETNEGIANYFSGGDNNLRIVYTVVSLFVYILLASAQLVAIQKLLTPIIGQTEAILYSVISYLFICIYIFRGGIVSVTRTDIVQFFVVILLFLIPSIYAVSKFSFVNYGENLLDYESMDFTTILYLSLSFLFVPLSQDIWVRVRQSSGQTATKAGIFLGVVFYAIIVTIAVSLGYFSKKAGISLDDPETVLSIVFQNQLGLAGFIPTIFILAAIYSTLDSFTFNISSILTTDVNLRYQYKQSNISKLIPITLVFIMCTFIGIFAKSILSLVLTGLMIYISVIGPSLILRYLGFKNYNYWIPASVTLAAIFTLGILKIPLWGEPYVFIVGHCMLIFLLNGIKNIREI